MRRSSNGTLQAVILAAGNGRRLITASGGIPKPLYRAAGKPLLDWVLDSFVTGGVRHFVIVVGYLADTIRRHLAEHDRPGVEIDLVVNPDFSAENGLSVLAARYRAEGNFLIGMADHLFEPSALTRLIEHGPVEEGIALAVDRKLDDVIDLAEATKAQVEQGRVRELGKGLTRFNGVDTGLFYAGPALIEALEQTRAKGQTALSDGVRLLASRGRVAAVDVGSARWIDVDTPQDLAQAENLLASSWASLALAPGAR